MKNNNEERGMEQSQNQTEQRKPYERPQLQKHGNVESLTQIQQLPGGSQPFNII